MAVSTEMWAADVLREIGRGDLAGLGAGAMYTAIATDDELYTVVSAGITSRDSRKSLAVARQAVTDQRVADARRAAAAVAAAELAARTPTGACAMTSRYPGRCVRCTGRFDAGTAIFYYAETKSAQHQSCPTRSTSTNPTTQRSAGSPADECRYCGQRRDSGFGGMFCPMRDDEGRHRYS